MHGPNPGAAADAAARQSPWDDDGAEQAIFTDINITPLVDVVLVLLIVFMVASGAMADAAREGRLDVSLPEAGAAKAPASPAPSLIVAMAEDGRLFVQGHFVSEAELTELLDKTHAQAPSTAVVVDADGRLSHQSVVRIIDRVRAAGFATVGIGAEGQAP